MRFKGKNMHDKRMVHKLSSVFDILNYRSILAPYTASIRVLFEYDAETGEKDFTILSNGIPEETCKLIVAMLKENITSARIIGGLDSNNLDYTVLTGGSVIEQGKLII
jgi:hypothetical protein